MERSVENGHVGLVLAKNLVGSFNAQDGGGVVQRRQGRQVLDGFDHIGRDQAAFLELFAAVDDAMADGINLAHRVDHLAVAGGHLLDDFAEGFGMGGEDCGRGCLLAVGLMGNHAAFHADAFAQAFAQYLLTVHIDELILQARRTAVDNQNFHGVSSFNTRGDKKPLFSSC